MAMVQVQCGFGVQVRYGFGVQVRVPTGGSHVRSLWGVDPDARLCNKEVE